MNVEQQSQDVALRQLQTLLEAQTRLRRAAEEREQETRRELERLAEGICPQKVDELRRLSPTGLDGLPPRHVADLALAAATPLLRAGIPADVQRCLEAEARAADVERRLRAAQEQAAQAAAESGLLREQLHALQDASDPLACQSQARRAHVRAAADLLTAAGYAIRLPPDPLPVPGDGALLPDLTLLLDGRTLAVEVEDGRRPLAEREARWAACYAVNGGHLCFVSPNRRALEALRSEVHYWAETRPLVLWMTDVERGGAQKGELVWLVRRQTQQSSTI